MIHLNFILYLLSFVAATASVTGAILFYFHYRKLVLIYYALMLSVPTLLLLHRIAELYCTVMIHQTVASVSTTLLIIEKIAFSIGIFIGPYFMHHLLGLPLSRLQKLTYHLIATVYIILAAVEITTLNFPVTKLLKNVLSMPLLFGMYGYCLVMAAINLKKLASPLLKKIVFLSFCISLIILPFSILQYIQQRPFLPGFMERPLLFIALFVLTIVFTINYFNRPAYFANKGLTDYFKTQFAITNRESEIILHVIQGHPNQTIGEKLFISTRTVESHLYSIFQKLGVKNRVQLTNLIQTNKN
jgi:DNA-binding CsgD family transcriptional regulator